MMVVPTKWIVPAAAAPEIRITLRTVKPRQIRPSSSMSLLREWLDCLVIMCVCVVRVSGTRQDAQSSRMSCPAASAPR